MKTLKLLFIFFLLSKVGYSQDVTDTLFKVNKSFSVRLQIKKRLTSDNNAKLTFLRDNKFLHSDSIFCFIVELQVKDMNQDGVKDLLVFESTGGRGGNGYYNLYLFNKKKDDFVKVIGYHNWPNLETTDAKSILVSTGLSADTYFHYLKLTDTGKLIDLNIEQIDNDGEGKSYEIGLRKAKRKANFAN